MLQVIQSLTAGATLLLAFLVLIHPRGANKVANRWLSLFLFFLFVTLLDDLFLMHKIYVRFPHLIGLTPFAVFLIPPTFYLAVSNFVAPDRNFKKRDALHFLLVILFFILDLRFFLKSGDVKLQILQTQTTTMVDIIIMTVVLLQVSIYWVWSFLKLIWHKETVEMVLASGEAVNLKWLRYFMIGFLVMILLWGTSIFYQSNSLLVLSNSIYFFVIFFLAFHALRQGEVYSFSASERKEVQKLIDEKSADQAEKKKLLSEEKLEEGKQNLTTLMDLQKPYLDKDLSLLKLASALQTTTHHLSYLLNEGYGENFFQFINRYRVEEAKKLLLNPDNSHLNMVGIAYSAGFNSKTVFNTTFKKITGLSPSDFKNQLAASSDSNSPKISK